jgi:hypothetical protein
VYDDQHVSEDNDRCKREMGVVRSFPALRHSIGIVWCFSVLCAVVSILERQGHVFSGPRTGYRAVVLRCDLPCAFVLSHRWAGSRQGVEALVKPANLKVNWRNIAITIGDWAQPAIVQKSQLSAFFIRAQDSFPRQTGTAVSASCVPNRIETLARHGKCAIFTSRKQHIALRFTSIPINIVHETRVWRGVCARLIAGLHQIRSCGCGQPALD